MTLSAPFMKSRLVLVACVLGCLTATASAAELNKKVQLAEEKRVAVINKVKPAVVAVFGAGGRGGGSGVLISDDGYALTNFHVTAGAGRVMKCGLPDGILYDAVVVGEDKVGDVALIKLLPKKKGDKFPFAPLGDSDKVKAGDWSLAMGNPFLLATDFTPTVTFGLISGVHRYQYPSTNGLLEYTDCIQIDTSINPGNSGGPLFNMEGELIGINGRGSFQKRSRINSGVGYAISINQIKNFLGHLRAGLEVDHASLGAFIRSDSDDGSLAKIIVDDIIDSDISRRGIQIDDELVTFGGRFMGSANTFKNVLGIYPKGWRVPLSYRRDGKRYYVLARLMGAIPRTINDPGTPPRRPGPTRPTPKTTPSPASKLYVAKKGYTNYYFNELERKRLWDDFVKVTGDYSKLDGAWTLTAKGKVREKDGPMELRITEMGAKVDVRLNINDIDYQLDPYNQESVKRTAERPTGTGGLITALYHYRRLLTLGTEGFRDVKHGGYEPFYPALPTLVDQARPKFAENMMLVEVLHTSHTGYDAKWFFDRKDHKLLGFELWLDNEKDPCEVFFSDYKKVGDKLLPNRMQVFHGDEAYCDMKDLKFDMKAKK